MMLIKKSTGQLCLILRKAFDTLRHSILDEIENLASEDIYGELLQVISKGKNIPKLPR